MLNIKQECPIVATIKLVLTWHYVCALMPARANSGINMSKQNKKLHPPPYTKDWEYIDDRRTSKQLWSDIEHEWMSVMDVPEDDPEFQPGDSLNTGAM